MFKRLLAPADRDHILADNDFINDQAQIGPPELGIVAAKPVSDQPGKLREDFVGYLAIQPELIVRKALREERLTGYRLHRKDLPGRPDIAFVGRKKAIFVHGCFWHGHGCKEGLRRPRSRQDYWLPKIAGNQLRDLQHQEALAGQGWDVLVLWDCDCGAANLANRLRAFVLGGSMPNKKREHE